VREGVAELMQVENLNAGLAASPTKGLRDAGAGERTLSQPPKLWNRRLPP
jgi:hypothetical protein